MKRFVPLLVLMAATLGAGALGGLFTSPAIPGWYAGLEKPSFNPPAAVFAPVWTTLYVLMAVAAWLVWERVRRMDAAMVAFALQLALNVGWSWIFFGLRQPGWAFAEILVLWAAIAVTMGLFFQRSRVAGWLLAPYLAWVTFAAVLNFAIWRLNQGPA